MGWKGGLGVGLLACLVISGVAWAGIGTEPSNDGRWLVTVDGPGNDQVVSVAGDPTSGNSWVLAFEAGAASPVELLEFDSTGGALVRSRSFTGTTTHWNPAATVIRTDGAGNVYLSWSSSCIDFGCTDTIDFGGGPVRTAALIKFDPQGNFLWQQSVDENGGQLAVNANGDAVVFASQYFTEPDVTVARFSPSGTRLWTAISRNLTALGIDPSGNVLVGADVMKGDTLFGTTPYPADGPAVAKLASADGSLIWAKQLSGARGAPTDIGTSSLGTVAVAGNFDGTFDFGGQHFDLSGSSAQTTCSPACSVLLVYEADGTQRFGRRLPDNDGNTRLAVDPPGKVSLVGQRQGFAAVSWYDLAGDFLDVYSFPTNNGGSVTSTSIAIAQDHSTLVGGYFSGTTDFGAQSQWEIPVTPNGNGGFALGGIFRTSSAGGFCQQDFIEDFGYSGSLSANWRVVSGSWTVNGTAALGSGNAYAFWGATPAADDTAAVTLATPIKSTYVGAIVRGTSSAPSRDHYVAYVDPNGVIHVARRNAYNYTYLADGPAFPSGSHVLGLTATGSGPVTLSVKLDGNEVIHYVDSSSSAIKVAGLSGMLDYSGARQPIDQFVASRCGSGSTGGGTGGTGGGGTGGTTVFDDEFNHSGALGSNWFIESGSWTDNGSAALGSGNAYAFWTGSEAADDSVAVTIATPLKSTYVGPITRGTSNLPFRDHYVAYVAPDGAVHLARRNAYNYSYLADGPAFPGGSHALSITASGSGPVTLSVKIDGNEVLHYVDSSSSAITAAGKAGMVDYQGAGQPIDAFKVTAP